MVFISRGAALEALTALALEFVKDFDYIQLELEGPRLGRPIVPGHFVILLLYGPAAGKYTPAASLRGQRRKNISSWSI